MISISRVLYTSKTLKKDGSHPIMFRLSKDRKSKYISTGYSASPEQWDCQEKMPNRKFANSVRMKHLLLKRELAIQEVVMEFDAKGEAYSLDDVLAKLNGSGKKLSIQEYVMELIERMDRTGKTGNARIYDDCLKSFDKYCEGRALQFEHLSYRKLKDYEEHMMAKGLKINTIAIRLRSLRAIINSAIKEGRVQERFYPFKNFKIKQESTRKRALSFEEIVKIEDYTPENEQLDWAKDLFLFSYYCMGMSFVDMAYLTKDDIIGNRLQYQRSKTGIRYNIGIHAKLKCILDKYNSMYPESNFLLPIVKDANRVYEEYRNDLRWLNRLLNRLGTKLNLSIPLTSYVSRHSWATIARRKGVPTGIISQGLGHTTERTTQIYLDSFESEVMDEMNLMIVGGS
jgi:integrase